LQEETPLPKEVANNIMKFRQANLLQKLALNAVARSLEDHQMRSLEKEFNKVCINIANA
jgi:hypothetical protein